jgi:hypothetical protein
MANNVIKYEINLGGNIIKGVANLGEEVKKTTGSMEKLTKTIGLIANAGFAFKHVRSAIINVSNAVRELESGYIEESIAIKKLETLMRNSIGATDDEIKSVLELASAQQKLGVIGDEVQIAGAQEPSQLQRINRYR